MTGHSPSLRAAMDQTLGVVLAGGQSRRMGFDKALATFQGRPMIAHVIDRLRPQTAALTISAQKPFDKFAAFRVPVFDDDEFAGHGPISGVCAALKWARALGGIYWVATAPTDMPFIPHDLVPRLLTALINRGGTIAAVTRDADSIPVLAVWHVDALDAIQSAMQSTKSSSLQTIQNALSALAVEFDHTCVRAFANLNCTLEMDAANAPRQFQALP